MPEKYYDQKYLDEKFVDVNVNIQELKLLINTRFDHTDSRVDKIEGNVAELKANDKLHIQRLDNQSKRIRDLKLELDGSKFYTVKGVIFVTGIVIVLMVAFLLNGVDLIERAI